jgi:retron-type reverse transcriptase
MNGVQVTGTLFRLKEDPYATNKNLRPLSIPTIFDRCMQSVWQMALEPWAEYQADKYSFGFRKGRSTTCFLPKEEQYKL